MGRGVPLILALLALLPAGRLSAVPLDGSGTLPAPTATVCVPPGVPPFASWRNTHAQAAILLDDRNRPILGIWASYTAQGVTINAIWVDGLLASVDNAVDRKEEPAWYDRGVSAVSSAVRSDRTQRCEWVKPPLKVPKGEQTWAPRPM